MKRHLPFWKKVQQKNNDKRTSDEISALRQEIEVLRGALIPVVPKRKNSSFDVHYMAWLKAAESSAEYFTANLYSKKRFPHKKALMSYCIGLLGGKVHTALEFGVFNGKTINHISACIGSEHKVYGFDSFEGLPENWRGDFVKGHFAVENLPEVRANVELIKGWFDETLPAFRAEKLLGRTVNLLHVDCDLYSSTKTIFDELENHLTEDAVIVFDEYFNYPGWELHEKKAFSEFLDRTGFTFEYLGCVPIHQQVAVRLTGRK